MSPTRPRNDGVWTSALSLKGDRLPLYLRDSEQQYWSQNLPTEQLFYLQFNRSNNAPARLSLAEFGQRVLAELQAAKVSKIVVDLRYILVKLTARDYFAGRDPALDAIRSLPDK